MKTLLHTLVIAAFLALLPLSPPANAVESDTSSYRLSDTVTSESLDAKIKEAEASTELDESTRKKLIGLYRSTQAYLEQADSHLAAANEFRTSRESAPTRARAIREEIDKRQQSEDTITTGITDKTPLAELDQVLLKEKANLAAVDAVLSDLQDRLLGESDRPNLARQRLTAAKQRMDQISVELTQLSTSNESPRLIEAQQWSLQSESKALGAEIKMLDQELLSAPMRLELLEAERDKATNTLKRMRTRIQLLENTVERTGG